MPAGSAPRWTAVTGVEAFGLFVEGLEIQAEGLVPLEALPEDVYRDDRAAMRSLGIAAGQIF